MTTPQPTIATPEVAEEVPGEAAVSPVAAVIEPAPQIASKPLGGGLKKQLVGAGAMALVGKVGTALAMFAVNAVLARKLSNDAFASFLLIMTFVSLGISVGLLGMQTAVLRMLAEAIAAGSRRSYFKVLSLTLAITVAGAALVGIAYWLVIENLLAKLLRAPPLHDAALSVGIAMALGTLAYMAGELFRGLKRIGLASLISGTPGGPVGTFSFLGSVLILSAIGGLTLASVNWLLVLALALNLLAALIVMPSAVRRGAPAADDASNPVPLVHFSLATTLAISIPLMVTMLVAQVMGQVDVWFVAGLFNLHDTALYGAAARFVTLVGLPLITINAVLPPYLAGMWAKREIDKIDRLMSVTSLGSTVYAVGVSAALYFGAAPLMKLVYGQAFAPAGMILFVLSLGQLAFVACGPAGFALAVMGRQKEQMIVMILSLGLMCVLAVWMGHRWGPIGVAWATVLANFVQKLTFAAVVEKTLGFKTYVRLASLRNVAARFGFGLPATNTAARSPAV